MACLFLVLKFVKLQEGFFLWLLTLGDIVMPEASGLSALSPPLQVWQWLPVPFVLVSIPPSWLGLECLGNFLLFRYWYVCNKPMSSTSQFLRTWISILSCSKFIEVPSFDNMSLLRRGTGYSGRYRKEHLNVFDLISQVKCSRKLLVSPLPNTPCLSHVYLKGFLFRYLTPGMWPQHWAKIQHALLPLLRFPGALLGRWGLVAWSQTWSPRAPSHLICSHGLGLVWSLPSLGLVRTIPMRFSSVVAHWLSPNFVGDLCVTPLWGARVTHLWHLLLPLVTSRRLEVHQEQSSLPLQLLVIFHFFCHISGVEHPEAYLH